MRNGGAGGAVARGGRRCAVSVAARLDHVVGVGRARLDDRSDPSERRGRPTRQASRDIETQCGDTGPDEGGNGESSGVGPRIFVVRASISAWAGASDMLSPSPSTGSCCATTPSANATSTVVPTPIVGSSGPSKWLDGLGHLDRDRGLYLHQVRLLDGPVVARTADSDRNTDVHGPILNGITLILRADIFITRCISENSLENARYIYRRKLYCIRVQTHADKQ